MSTAKFSVVNVFSTTPYKGNPLAVVDDLSASLSTTQMQLITRQFNLSETTFVNPPTVPGAAFRLRSFLPDGKEVFGAGHNSLGALWWLAKHGHLADIPPSSTSGTSTTTEFNQEMASTAMPVTVSQDSSANQLKVTLRQAPPKFHGVHPSPSKLAQLLGIPESSIGFEWGPEKRHVAKAQVVSTATTRHLLVPLADVSVLNSVCSLDREKMLTEIQAADKLAYGLFLFAPESHDAASDGKLPVFQARFFSPGMSGEDPATGSAAGPMGAYLHKYGVFDLNGKDQDLTVLQGTRVGRACYLTITVGLLQDQDGVGERESVSTYVTGDGVEVLSGNLVVPAVETEF
ncbi:hypothetical protein FQN57_005032 [Myotisia sp. PD_48]|nr:hypothetical protein FQN57_005032 [Myotisia sp. PD_48]